MHNVHSSGKYGPVGKLSQDSVVATTQRTVWFRKT